MMNGELRIVKGELFFAIFSFLPLTIYHSKFTINSFLYQPASKPVEFDGFKIKH